MSLYYCNLDYLISWYDTLEVETIIIMSVCILFEDVCCIKKKYPNKIFHRVRTSLVEFIPLLDLQNLLELISIYFNNCTASPNVLDWSQVSYLKVYLYYP